jgi:hypothetical protein
MKVKEHDVRAQSVTPNDVNAYVLPQKTSKSAFLQRNILMEKQKAITLHPQI